MDIYLVGGALRDRLMGREAVDRDFVVIGGSEDAFRERYPGAKRVGARNQWTWLVAGEEYTLSDAADIQEDLRGRDLTVNAIAEDQSGRIHSLPGALQDIEQRVLRPVALENYLSDPNRSFRGARFAACLPDFAASSELVSAMRETARRGLLPGISAERVGMELRKACACPGPGRFLRMLARGECLQPWFAELEETGEAAAGEMDLAAGDGELVWMALCANLAPEQADTLAARLKLSARLSRAGAMAARFAGKAADYPVLPPGEKVDMLVALDAASLLDEVAELARRVRGQDNKSRMRADLEAIKAVRLPKALRNLGPESGRRLRQMRIEMLGSSSGRLR